MSITNFLQTKVVGHVKIQDRNTLEVLRDEFNAVHPKNMGIAIARGLSNTPKQCIYKIKMGNGGTYQSGNGEITYLSPNIVGTGPSMVNGIPATGSSLYNFTYTAVVDDQSTAQVGAGNSVIHPVAEDNLGGLFSTVVISAIISSGPGLTGQAISDSPAAGTDPNFNPTTSTLATTNQFVFDELGLFTEDEYLLTHLIFSPIEKTANRELLITYTLTITVSGA